MKRVIITGASGPLGIVLINECIRNNVEVMAIVRPDSRKQGDVPMHPLVHIVKCDICNIRDLINTTDTVYDVCFHLAWTHTSDEGRNNPVLQAENILYTLNVAEFAQRMGCKTFIGAGSQAEYGPQREKIDESTNEKPTSLYGITKLAAGHLVMEYCRQHDMRCNWIRIFAVYGPYENDYILTSYIIRTLLAKEKPILTQSEQIWDYLYCEDAAKALYLVADRANASGIYCLGSGRGQSLATYITMIRDAIDPELPLGIGEKPYADNQIMHLEADITKITTEVGFKPSFSFQEGIEKTIAWYQKDSRF